jgi:hypothetical protein
MSGVIYVGTITRITPDIPQDSLHKQGTITQNTADTPQTSLHKHDIPQSSLHKHGTKTHITPYIHCSPFM